MISTTTHRTLRGPRGASRPSFRDCAHAVVADWDDALRRIRAEVADLMTRPGPARPPAGPTFRLKPVSEL
ncbi:hypothetical protein [Streptomyces sp. NRRL S-920]|uniref:hypothetical protein n=1 Tax=Streptomyces sp. NRRL S-920 TaxID=1463921 RepID=UPI0004CBCC6B|nr:hypothetical protein [Streptomyces sp. NRRL S-920]